MAYLGGFIEVEDVKAAADEPHFATATERLEAFLCRSDETKMIIMGGIEDGFDPAGEESFEPPESLLNYLADFNDPETVRHTTRYDDPAQNRYFSTEFDIPANTFRGMIAIGLEQRSDVQNDGIRIGIYTEKIFSLGANGKSYGSMISEMGNEWHDENSYYWSNLDDLHLTLTKEKKEGVADIIGISHETLIDAIRDNPNDNLSVYIADDTVVDFIGFALCLEPAEKMGTVFDRYHHAGEKSTVVIGAGVVSLFSKAVGNGGFISCAETRSVPCIHDLNVEAPAGFNQASSGLWSGGYIKFTTPVRGDRFETEDGVDAFCAAEFGAEWRSLNSKDGAWTGAVYGFGEYPEGHDDFWISYKDAPHHNCWELRMDYDDVAAHRAQNE